MSSVVAKTDAAGGATLHPQVLAFSSSLKLDRALLKEDLIGSLAHIAMLARQQLVPQADARAIHHGLVSLWEDAAKGTLTLPDEEDVHMAVEAELHRRIGAPSQVLHTARSRNDQVATDLRLWTREQCVRTLESIGGLVGELLQYAEAGRAVVLPAYTHRQRAQPISLAYWWASWAAGLLRDGEAFRFVLEQADTLALGVGAISGTSLATDRESVREALGFSRLTENGLDTVGDRDFALDFLYASTRLLVRLGRLSTDLIDFSSKEFGFVTLGAEIACGSSMMPHKRNPDLFELLRGKSGSAIGALTGLLATVKGLPGGYNRDLQEDRGPLLEMGVRLEECLSVLRLGLKNVRFEPEACRAALEDGSTQATDLAEALVKKGIAFRDAYQAVGRLVRSAREQNLPLAKLTVEQAAQVDPRFDAKVLTVLEPLAAAARKNSAGGTGELAIAQQLVNLAQSAAAMRARAQSVPRLDGLFSKLKENWK
ncbi:MAG: Argininosuccinate lyase [Myxococcaceae bacterium]|nr:Argininosuccinate lyase [Myxococcaceae bacterium]